MAARGPAGLPPPAGPGALPRGGHGGHGQCRARHRRGQRVHPPRHDGPPRHPGTRQHAGHRAGLPLHPQPDVPLAHRGTGDQRGLARLGPRGRPGGGARRDPHGGPDPARGARPAGPLRRDVRGLPSARPALAGRAGSRRPARPRARAPRPGRARI
ncbi:hypothetical protein SDC9_200206 [bioreactor metagenome]|uniref:Uncharacterized protein n=1 Tax=bioreactor metagenome TaxID=1076179 RepID=A0A645IVW9_9ZZZZ